MQARMKNPAMIILGAKEALQALAKAAEQGGVLRRTLDLVHLRASQIMAAASEWTWPFARISQVRQTRASS